MFASCTKEGPQGIAGKDGVDGIDGKDGTVNCIECHDNSQEIFTKQNQWAASGHALNGNYTRNTTTCAPCHTSQGFLEVLESDSTACVATINDPTPPNCYSCHKIHDTYTEDDWALTNSDPVTFWLDNVQSDQGTANQCIRCHQARIPSPKPDLNGTGTVSITSSNFGPHYGVQGQVFEGIGGFEIGTGYTNSSHKTMLSNSCVDCHMATAYGNQAGGHQMGMTYGTTTISYLTTGCTSCHSDATALKTKITTTQAEISNLQDSLQTILVAKGHLTTSGSAVSGTYTHEQAGIIYNWRYVYCDHSHGVHNYPYVKTLLQNSIAAASAKK